MHSLRRLDIGEGKRILQKIKSFVGELSGEGTVKEAYVFGSFARGDWNEASDIDLLLIGDFRLPFLDRYAAIRPRTYLPIEPFCYTKQEAKEMLERKNGFMVEALKGKRIL